MLPEPTAAAAPRAAGPGEAGVKSAPRAWTWAALMHRAFGIDVLAYPQCGGRPQLIAMLHDPAGQSPGPAPPERRRRVLIRSAWGDANAVVSASRGGIPAESAGPQAD